METITYEQFAALEIKIGTILEVAVVPESDKLLKLTVDVGEETPRQIVSGIRTFFEDPQVLVGRQCPFLTNLAPRTIRGFESQGMILAVSTADGAFSLLSCVDQIPPGSRIK